MGGTGQHVADDVGLGDPRRNAVVEMTLLLTSRQLEALERAAYCMGLTTGHFIRRLVREFIESQDARTFCELVTSDASAD